MHLQGSHWRQQTQQLQDYHGTNPSCCENRGHLWDMAATYPAGVKWGDAAPVFDDGPVYRIASTLEQISIMRTRF